MDEMELLKRARKLDEAALGMIFDTYYPLLYRYIYHHVGHVQAAEDLAAKVFQRLLQQFYQGAGPEHHLKAWLFQVAANLVVDDVRRQSLRDHDSLDDQTPGEAEDFEDASETHLLVSDVHAALLRLTPRQRDVILLRYMAGLTLEEVAGIFGMSVGSIKALQHRALTALRRKLVEQFPEGDER